MDKLEKIEKIIEKTGVSYAEAKNALEEAGEDLLDAIVLLESQGKIKKPEMGSYTTKTEETSEAFREAAMCYEEKDGDKFGHILVRILKLFGHLIKKGCENFFIVIRYGQEVVNAPVIVLILLLCCTFWVIVPLMIVGMFFGYSYSFSGTITQSVDINKACDKAAEAAETVRQEFSQEFVKGSSNPKNK